MSIRKIILFLFGSGLFVFSAYGYHALHFNGFLMIFLALIGIGFSYEALSEKKQDDDG